MPPNNVFGGFAGDQIVFNFADIVTGRTSILFYGFSDSDAGGNDHILTQIQTRSDPKLLGANATLDLDFDILVNKPITIEGDVLINYKFGQSGGGGGGGAIAVTFTLKRVLSDGTTEEEIATKTSSDFTPGGDGSQKLPMTLQVTSKETFSIDETIRLNAVVTGGGGAGLLATLWFDPETAGDELKMWLPTIVQQ